LNTLALPLHAPQPEQENELSENINVGGQAFPGLNAEFTGISSEGQERYEIQPSGGMTLRDYFAAKALAALLSRVETVTGDYVTNASAVEATEAAYKYADAMLCARSA
jgi:hypothetical protein